jgi:hypothetical protein
MPDTVELVLASDPPIRQIAVQLGVLHEALRS